MTQQSGRTWTPDQPERRDEQSREALRRRVRGHFEEQRGLRVTAPQARRLFGVREDVCVRVLRELVTRGDLVQAGERFQRPESSSISRSVAVSTTTDGP